MFWSYRFEYSLYVKEHDQTASFTISKHLEMFSFRCNLDYLGTYNMV
jgi:hypothetical protein